MTAAGSAPGAAASPRFQEATPCTPTATLGAMTTPAEPDERLEIVYAEALRGD